MIFGSIRIEDDAVITHRDSYVLDTITVVSTRRPLLVPAVIMAFGLGGFGLRFSDLLHAHEVVGLMSASAMAMAAGSQIGLLSLLSRDLKSLEQSGAIWGWYPALRRHRDHIVAAIGATQKVRAR